MNTNFSYTNLDLDINNYNLDDLLALFHIPINFTREQLKNVKRVVLMTHPDKSGQPKEVFLFFTAAYKTIHQIYTFRTRSDALSESGTVYSADVEGKVEVDSSVLEKFNNKWFNSTWEKHKANAFADEEGYGDWLKEEEEEDVCDNKPKTMDDVNRQVSKRKEQIRTLVVRGEVSEYGSLGMYGHSSISRDKPSCYEAPVFGNLQYDDIRRAYTESVVPVTDEDYKARKQFSNQDQLQRFRGQDFNEHFQSSDHKAKLREMNLNDEINGARRAYELARQDEQLRSVREGWSASLLRLR